MLYKQFALIFGLFLFGWICESQAQELIPVSDHHIHIRSQESSSALVKLQQELSGTEIPELPPTGADDVIPLLNNANINSGVLLSVAYFFGAPDIDFSNEYEKTKQENNYVSREAAKYPARLTAFCSVSPLADYAKDEIERCSTLPQVAGLKLHLANSDVDLRKEKHKQKLISILKHTAQLDLAVVIHLFTRNPKYGKKDAQIFVEEILTHVPNLDVQIAHLGGAGAYDRTTAEVVEYFFHEAATTHSKIFDEDLFFDLSAVVINPEIASARGDSTRAREIKKNNEEVVKKIEELNTNRFLFGTDWIAVSRKPEAYAKLFRSLSWSDSTLRSIFENKAPYLVQ